MQIQVTPISKAIQLFEAAAKIYAKIVNERRNEYAEMLDSERVKYIAKPWYIRIWLNNPADDPFFKCDFEIVTQYKYAECQDYCEKQIKALKVFDETSTILLQQKDMQILSILLEK